MRVPLFYVEILRTFNHRDGTDYHQFAHRDIVDFLYEKTSLSQTFIVDRSARSVASDYHLHRSQFNLFGHIRVEFHQLIDMSRKFSSSVVDEFEDIEYSVLSLDVPSPRCTRHSPLQNEIGDQTVHAE